MSGECLGNVWEMSGECLGNVWGMSGKCLGKKPSKQKYAETILFLIKYTKNSDFT